MAHDVFISYSSKDKAVADAACATLEASPQVMREVERAASAGAAVIPFRIEDIAPSKSLQYFIGPVHWLDALTPPLEQHLERLAETVRLLLDRLDPGASARRAHNNPRRHRPPSQRLHARCRRGFPRRERGRGSAMSGCSLPWRP